MIMKLKAKCQPRSADWGSADGLCAPSARGSRLLDCGRFCRSQSPRLIFLTTKTSHFSFEPVHMGWDNIICCQCKSVSFRNFLESVPQCSDGCLNLSCFDMFCLKILEISERALESGIVMSFHWPELVSYRIKNISFRLNDLLMHTCVFHWDTPLIPSSICVCQLFEIAVSLNVCFTAVYQR